MIKGTGENGELTFFDIISIMSFLIGLMNLEENITQGDMQDLQHTFSQKADTLLHEIHSHLAQQDYLLKKILEELQNDGK